MPAFSEAAPAESSKLDLPVLAAPPPDAIENSASYSDIATSRILPNSLKTNDGAHGYSVTNAMPAAAIPCPEFRSTAGAESIAAGEHEPTKCE